MKIKDICEETADDLERALIHYSDSKRKEHERLHSGSKLAKGFWKGKRAIDKLKYNPAVDAIKGVHNWAMKHSK